MVIIVLKPETGEKHVRHSTNFPQLCVDDISKPKLSLMIFSFQTYTGKFYKAQSKMSFRF